MNVSDAELHNAIALSTKAASKIFGWDTTKNSYHRKREEGNELTSLIPGYTAPMSLDSSPLDVYKSSDLTNRVSETTKCVRVAPQSNTNFKHRSRTSIASLRSKTNAGDQWFNMESTPKSESLEADIAVIRNRNYLDPKRFYKSSAFKKEKDVGVVQLGTVIEGAMESIYTNRLTKRQKKSTVMEEVMGEVFAAKDDYVKKTYGKLQRKKRR